MSLRTYTGEYLVSPVPLHLDLDICSHACWWCFSRLNNPDRLADYGPHPRRGPGRAGPWS
ncbi:MAG: hypothetical protein V1797_06470 [Pseudomonadota bacterium]